jgi:cell division protein YceG involved in septum cleavage
MGRLMGKATTLKAGFYELDRPVTPYELLRKITQGDYTLVSITLVEGWTFRQCARRLLPRAESSSRSAISRIPISRSAWASITRRWRAGSSRTPITSVRERAI